MLLIQVACHGQADACGAESLEIMSKLSLNSDLELRLIKQPA